MNKLNKTEERLAKNPPKDDDSTDDDNDDVEPVCKKRTLRSNVAGPSSSGRPHILPVSCIICHTDHWIRDKVTCKRRREPLTRWTIDAGKLRKAAELTCNESLLLQMRGRDLVDSEARYHPSCFRNATRFLTRKWPKETTDILYAESYAKFCHNVIDEQILKQQGAIRMTKLTAQFIKMVKEVQGIDASSYRSYNLKKRLQGSYPQLHFLRPTRRYESEVVISRTVEAQDLAVNLVNLQDDTKSSNELDTSSGSESDLQHEQKGFRRSQGISSSDMYFTARQLRIAVQEVHVHSMTSDINWTLEWLWRRRRRRRSPAPAPPADTTPPTFTNCRSHWTVPITTTSTVVTWTEPTATDDRPIRMQGGSGYCHGPPPVCMMPIFDISPTRSGPAPGSTFTEGRHAVTYTAQDLAGNIATCRIEFTVEIIRCPPIPPVSNGVHVCTYGVIGGSQCVFSCHHGYTLSGSATTHCNADTRRWSSPIPTCQVKTCSPPLVAPSHGSVSCSDSNRFMSLCTFYCDEGFEIPSGQSSALFCNGHVWSANPPICQDVKPPEFTACPTSFDVNIQSATSDSALVSYNSPRAVDNSGHVTIRLVEGKASGSRFDSGANTVKYRAEDGAGNIIECNFTINVIIIIVTG
ncbi:hypothetical protein BSL78_14229 [Apostichopus japonicus]|uniref:Uncharacterized protein n=1 Tax=Stichopus japonicus TaxID=307972 RepID=A0A2G8KLJ7_STIJA|nr:hypothetical protein BSL78_14229 [Apostichopus japonicus]